MTDQEVCNLKLECLRIALATGTLNVEERAKQLFKWVMQRND